jgi:hypothetical protein
MERAPFLFTAILTYLLPSILAYADHHEDRGTVLFFNLFLGWTGAVWVLCILWVLWTRYSPARPTPRMIRDEELPEEVVREIVIEIKVPCRVPLEPGAGAPSPAGAPAGHLPQR